MTGAPRAGRSPPLGGVAAVQGADHATQTPPRRGPGVTALPLFCFLTWRGAASPPPLPPTRPVRNKKHANEHVAPRGRTRGWPRRDAQSQPRSCRRRRRPNPWRDRVTPTIVRRRGGRGAAFPPRARTRVRRAARRAPPPPVRRPRAGGDPRIGGLCGPRRRPPRQRRGRRWRRRPRRLAARRPGRPHRQRPPRRGRPPTTQRHARVARCPVPTATGGPGRAPPRQRDVPTGGCHRTRRQTRRGHPTPWRQRRRRCGTARRRRRRGGRKQGRRRGTRRGASANGAASTVRNVCVTEPRVDADGEAGGAARAAAARPGRAARAWPRRGGGGGKAEGENRGGGGGGPPPTQAGVGTACPSPPPAAAAASARVDARPRRRCGHPNDTVGVGRGGARNAMAAAGARGASAAAAASAGRVDGRTRRRGTAPAAATRRDGSSIHSA